MSIDKTTGHWIYSDYSGITHIDQDDKKRQLHISQTLDVEPFHYLSVIKMNSTYLELCNRQYHYYGLLSCIGIGILTIFLIILPISVFWGYVVEYYRYGMWRADSFGLTLFTFLIILLNLIIYRIMAKSVVSKEFNSFYYLPIRLNRKTRKVYVYQATGDIKILDWEKLFVYIAPINKLYGFTEYELRAAIVNDLDEVEFSFSFGGPTAAASDVQQCASYWEFIKQYMQEGPKKFYIDQHSLKDYDVYHLSYCNDIDAKLESYASSKKRIVDNYKFSVSDLFTVGPIFYPWLWVRHYLIKHQAKVPYWPVDIQQQCQTEKDDPYIVDASINQYFEIKSFPAHMRVKRKYLD